MKDDLRPGEQSADLPPPTDAGLRFIGRIETPFARREDCPRQGDSATGPECRIVLDPLYAPALEGLDPPKALEIYYWLHESRRDLLRQSKRGDGETLGTFALRSPVRPNPIGHSRVRMVGRDENVLIVRGLDCISGTPLLDIKPDRCPHA